MVASSMATSLIKGAIHKILVKCLLNNDTTHGQPVIFKETLERTLYILNQVLEVYTFYHFIHKT